MVCETIVMIKLDDDELHRKARKKLGLPIKGRLTEYHAGLVRVEVGVAKTYSAMRRLDPTAIIRRKGNELTVSVQR